MKARPVGLIAVLFLASISTVVPTASSAEVIVPGCAPAEHAGGEWRQYGHDDWNTRSQPDENVINPSTVRNVEPHWVFKASAAVPPPPAASGGRFANTPVIADGCMFVATSTGWVIAVNADTGKGPDGSPFVWRQWFKGAPTGLIADVITGSPLVRNGVVYVGVSDPGKPYVAAMDEQTGAVLWTSRVTGVLPGQEQRGVVIVASPVEVNGVIFMGFAGNEGQDNARGGYAILDASPQCGGNVVHGETVVLECPNPVPGATGGTVLRHRHTIDDDEYAEGYRGTSVWCTAAADPAEGYVFGCGGNPASKRLEHRYSNALMKIDVARLRPDPLGIPLPNPRFGDIVAAYKGNVDQYYPGLDRQPACDMLGEEIVYVAWSVTCLQLDLDFGASPHLFTTTVGTKTVKVLGDVQKSGVYHAVYSDNMQSYWSQIVGAPCFPCNAASPALLQPADPSEEPKIFAAATPPGYMVGLSSTGRHRWAAPIGGGTHFQATSAANGVVYTVDNAGTLSAFDADLGVVLMRRPLSLDVGESAVDAASQGVAIARNRIYAASRGFIVAYGP